MLGRVPDKTRIYAIGDIHGCSQKLRELLALIAKADADLPDVETRRLIFLGDYVDRGPDSRGVIDVLLNELPSAYEPLFLKGNHEAMMLDCLDERYPLAHWFVNGGRSTVESYGIGCPPVAGDDDYAGVLGALRAAVAGTHLDFLKTLKTSARYGGYFFAHAGIDPDRPLDQQLERDLLWIRHRFLDATTHYDAIVVHGHTPTERVIVDGNRNRIGIDTGAVYGGRLSALRLEGSERQLLSVEADRSRRRVAR